MFSNMTQDYLNWLTNDEMVDLIENALIRRNQASAESILFDLNWLHGLLKQSRGGKISFSRHSITSDMYVYIDGEYAGFVLGDYEIDLRPYIRRRNLDKLVNEGIFE